jgi:hypothetical protein
MQMLREIKLSKVLDTCISRTREGDTVKACLTRFPNMRKQLEPLLCVATSVAAAQKVSTSAIFRGALRNRLMARIKEESDLAERARSQQSMKRPHRFAMGWQQLADPRRLAIAIAFSIIIVLGATAIGTSSIFSNHSSPPSNLVSNCTLTVINGNVSVKSMQSAIWEDGADGLTLAAGTRVKTAAQSQALLTFFEGSTIRLEANTDLEIEQVERIDEKCTAIVLKQYLGQTWSIVAKLTDPRSRYEIHTPSALAMVRGTSFVTEVDNTGLTQVRVNEGVVAVKGQERQVSVQAGNEVQVMSGGAPSQPTPTKQQSNSSKQGEASNDKSNSKTIDSTEGEQQLEKTDSKGQDSSQGNSQGSSGDQGVGNSNGNANGQDNANGNSNSNGNANGQDNANGNSNGAKS